MSTVLVLGATGLLGSAVFDEVAARGHEVHGAARQAAGFSGLLEVDLTDVGQIEELLDSVAPDVVVQMTGGPASDPMDLVQTHLFPTTNLLTAVTRSQARLPALITTGSAAEYGAPESSERVNEETRLNPVTGYGWIKSAETALAMSIARTRGLELKVVRPFNIVSPDISESTALGNFRRQIIGGSGPTREVQCGRVDIVRDYVTPAFVGKAIAELIEVPYEGVINICSGHGIALEDLLNAAAAALDTEIRFSIDPQLASMPAPDWIVGDPSLLYSLVEVRATGDPYELARVLLGSDALLQA